MPAPTRAQAVRDRAPDADDFLREVLAGLRTRPRWLPCKYFYDAAGSELFERICELDEYYPTRTELSILEAHAPEMGRYLGPRCLLVEFGSGSGRKTRLLLEHLEDPAGYVPVEISRHALEASVACLAREYPELPILPVCADYLAPWRLPEAPGVVKRRAVFFPGSTIGNFDPHEARAFLERVARTVEPGGALLIGVDLRKDPAVLEAAYDDREGVTAAFDRNLLVRMQRELGAEVDPDAFEHRARWNDAEGRVEMHLVSRRPQEIRVGGEVFHFDAGESIHTENSYKWTLEGFAELAGSAGFDVQRVWTDPKRWFSVQYLVAR